MNFITCLPKHFFYSHFQKEEYMHHLQFDKSCMFKDNRRSCHKLLILLLLHFIHFHQL